MCHDYVDSSFSTDFKALCNQVWIIPIPNVCHTLTTAVYVWLEGQVVLNFFEYAAAR